MPQFAERVLHPNDLLALRYVHDARFSPDGRRVAYVTSRTAEEPAEELFEITIEDLATGAKREIPFPGRATYPRWSPDGKQLAFIGAAGNSQRLYLADPHRDALRALTAESDQVQGPPSWTPDGSAIACSVLRRPRSDGVRRITKRVFRSEGLGEIDNVRSDLQLVDIQRGVARTLDLGGITGAQPAFSPCGKRLLFLGADSAVGYASFGDWRAWDGYRHTVEHSVYVRTDQRGKGVGEALMHALIKRARRIGKHVMVAGIEAKNAGSIRLHEKLGFEHVGHLKQVGTKFGGWLDLLFLQLILDERAEPDGR